MHEYGVASPEGSVTSSPTVSYLALSPSVGASLSARHDVRHLASEFSQCIAQHQLHHHRWPSWSDLTNLLLLEPAEPSSGTAAALCRACQGMPVQLPAQLPQPLPPHRAQ